MCAQEARPRVAGARGVDGTAGRQQAGLTGTANGALLRRAAGDFDVFLTVDANLEYQQNTSALALPVVVLIAPTNAIQMLRLLMPQVRELLPTIRQGQLYRVGPPKPMR